MKHLYLLLTLGLCYSLNVSAQYFNTPLFNAGFDTAEKLNEWAEDTAPASEVPYWKLEEANKSFSLFDPKSTNSLKFGVTKEGQFLSVLTSPEIDVTAHKGLAIGFYHANLSMQAHQKIYYFIEVSTTDGAVRDTLFNSEHDSFKGTFENGWRYIFDYLPQKYDNKKIKFRLIVDAQKFTGNKASFYLDGFYLTTRHQNDANLYHSNMIRENLNLSSNDRAFSNAEPITVKIKNNGIKSLESINLFYQIDKKEPVKETFVPGKAIQMGDSAQYTFKTKADLGKFRTSYSFKTWVDLSDDSNHSNDTVAELLQNIVTDLPYIPQFWFDKNGYINTDDDKWATDANYNSGWWRANGAPKPGYWYIDFSRAAEDCNAVLRSRPIYLKAGVKYEMRFNAYTHVDALSNLEDNQKNKLSISITKDPKGLENLTQLWKNEALDKSNGLDSSIRFEVTEDAAYFISFNCTSSKTAKELRVRDFYFVTAPKADAKPTVIVAPSDIKYIFGKSEAVEISILNNGLESIAANKMKVCAKLNEGSVIEETVSQAIPANSTLNYTFNNTFDLSDLTRKHAIQIWTNLEGDENLLNDTVAKVVESKVAGIPYTADFSLNTDGTYASEKDMWEVVDGNEDGATFVAERLDKSNAFLFSYGGTTVTPVSVTNESLYARPIMLQAGSKYRIQYAANILPDSLSHRSLNLKTVLYKLVDGKKVEKQILCDEPITAKNSKVHIISVAEDGVYVIGYHVRKDEPVDFKVKINNLKVTKTIDADIALNEILLGARNISAYKSLPIGVHVSNPGINAIEEFTVTVSASSFDTRTQTFRKSIAPLDSAFVYFDKEFTFTGAEEETLSVVVSMENDGFESNNTKSLAIGYLENAQLPYTAEFIPEEGFLGIDQNRDGSRFKAYQSVEPVLGLPTQIYGYSISGGIAEGSDLLMSRSLNFEAGKIYKMTFGYIIGNSTMIVPSLDIYALNIRTGERTPVTALVSDGKGDLTARKYMGYFSVKESDVYALCFAPMAGNVQNLREKLIIEEVSEKPDVTINSIMTPAKDAVFGKTENIDVVVRNSGTQQLQGVSFSCQVADTTYYASMTDLWRVGKETSIQFKNVNLSEPGDYTLTIQADVQADKTPENNTFSKVIKSLPIIEMEMRSIDSPKSGNLTDSEAIKISVVNNGKGVITEVPVHYLISHVETNKIESADEIIKTQIGEGEVFQFTFDKKANLSEEGTYNIVAYVDAANETVLTNDTVSISIVSTNKVFDVGVSAITNPVDGLHTETEQVTVKVTNYGEVDIYDVPVFAVVKKGEEIVKELSGLIKQCSVGSTAEYTFTEVANMYLYGEYDITAYTKAETDRNAENDTCKVAIKSLKADCGVVEIVNPGNEFEVGMQLITVVVKNFGEVALTDIPVKFKVGTMPQNGKIEGSLAPGESVTYTFPREYNFRTEQEYTLTVYTDLAIDMDKENDALKKVIKALPVGIQSESDVELSIYPNPVKDVLNIKANDEILKSVVVYDRSGKVLLINKDINDKTFMMSLGRFAEGMYLLQIETERGRTVYKVLKEN